MSYYSFNPRPPLLAGDAQTRLVVLPCQRVSIRARHCWRAMRCCRVMLEAGSVFQSAPAIAGGRCIKETQHVQPSYCFNPRPPLLAGDAPGWAKRIAGMKFQSAPAIAGGRCWVMSGQVNRIGGFNPRPPLLAGDAHCSATSRLPFCVSIRARHCWRAMPCARQELPQCGQVSIRARHCWRAMPPSVRLLKHKKEVSIRARHCWRAMPDRSLALRDTTDVSIRARHCWRAMLM